LRQKSAYPPRKRAVLTALRLSLDYLGPDKNRECADELFRELGCFHRNNGDEVGLQRSVDAGWFAPST